MPQQRSQPGRSRLSLGIHTLDSSLLGNGHDVARLHVDNSCMLTTISQPQYLFV
jgi:hypothetical protein